MHAALQLMVVKGNFNIVPKCKYAAIDNCERCTMTIDRGNPILGLNLSKEIWTLVNFESNR
jgi:hypothetical protein